jgi:hypothetical protein
MRIRESGDVLVAVDGPGGGGGHHGTTVSSPENSWPVGLSSGEERESDGARCCFGRVAAGGCGAGVEVGGTQARRERVDRDAVAGERLRVGDGQRVEPVFDERYAALEPVPVAWESNCGLGPVLQVSDPVLLETLTIRGWAERRSAGRNALVTATTPKTLVS